MSLVMAAWVALQQQCVSSVLEAELKPKQGQGAPSLLPRPSPEHAEGHLLTVLTTSIMTDSQTQSHSEMLNCNVTIERVIHCFV